MSIYSLHEKGLINVNESAQSATVDSNITIAFALDSGYADCLKVMLASMAHNGILCRNPIVIYTDDPKLSEDPIVKIVADKISVLSGKKKELLYMLAKDNVQRPERADWNRGTFLKWSVFEPQETTKLLFLDVDMLVLNSLSGLLTAFTDKPLVTCPQFQQTIKSENTDAQLTNLLNGNFDNKHKRRINSGVMLVSEDYLSDTFFADITQYASERVSIHEQGLMSEYFYNKSECLGMAPSAFNYQDSYLRLASEETYKEILNNISILHYAGAVKPWSNSSSSVSHMRSIQLWHEYKKIANELLSVV
tara:strand:+ start:8798 stop:9715 length:918 start_codon:yes stop_codon:yes gene_type:complete